MYPKNRTHEGTCLSSIDPSLLVFHSSARAPFRNAYDSMLLSGDEGHVTFLLLVWGGTQYRY